MLIQHVVEKFGRRFRSFQRRAVVMSSGILLWLVAGSAVGQTLDDIASRHLPVSASVTDAVPVVVRASELAPAVKGLPNSRIGVLTYKAGDLVPIPFQIDEMDETGLVYADHKDQADLLGLRGIFDGEDELLFMLGDAGSEPAPVSVLQRYQVLEVLQLALPSQPEAVVYIVRDDMRRAEAKYVSADLNKGVIETDSLKLSFDPEEFSDISAIQLKDEQAKLTPNILSDLQLKISTGILNKKVRLSADLGEQIRLKPLSVVTGPVRAALLLEVRFRFLGLTLHRDTVAVNFYRRSVNVPTRFTTSSLRSARLFLSLLRQPRIEFNVAFSGLQDATLQVDSYLMPGRVYRGVIDGQMSLAEREANEETLPGDYIWLAAPQGWHGILTNTLPVVPQGLFDSYLKGLDIQVTYDDVPEPAHAMRASVTIEGIPKVALDLLFELNRLGLDETENLGELLARLSEKDDAGKLKRFDALNQQIIAERVAQGLIQQPSDYTESFIQDLGRISLRGVDRSQLNLAIRRAMLQIESVDELKQMRLGPLVSALRASAAALDLDLTAVSRASLDNTIWFAQGQSTVDPQAFYEAASHLIFTPQVSARQRVADSAPVVKKESGGS